MVGNILSHRVGADWSPFEVYPGGVGRATVDASRRRVAPSPDPIRKTSSCASE